MNTYRKFLLVLMLLAGFSNIHAQYLHLGYQVNRVSFSGLNTIVDVHNLSNSPGLTNKMGHFGWLSGVTGGFGMRGNNALIDWFFNFSGQRQTANGPDWNGNEFDRELSVKVRTGGFSYNRFFESKPVAFALGVRTELGAMKLAYRTWETGAETPEFTKLKNYLYGTMGPNFLCTYLTGNFGLQFNVHYSIGFGRTNMTYIDEQLNLTYYGGENDKRHNNRGSYLGLNIRALFYFAN